MTVNAVLPGWIATASQLPDEMIGGQSTPLGRSGTPDEVAAVIAFLAWPRRVRRQQVLETPCEAGRP